MELATTRAPRASPPHHAASPQQSTIPERAKPRGAHMGFPQSPWTLWEKEITVSVAFCHSTALDVKGCLSCLAEKQSLLCAK